jgi:chromosome segregation ATPase
MNFSTSKKVFLAAKNFPGLVLIILVGLSSLSCASSTNGNFNSDSLHKENDKYLSFYEVENDKNVHWEVNFENEEIASVFRDGERIPSEDVDEYRAMINEKLDEIRFGLRKHSFKMDHFTFDLDEFHSDMEKFNEQMHSRFECLEDFKFDDEEFNNDMKKLQRRLEKLKDRKFDLKFDSKKFKEQMEKLHEQFNDQQFNFEFDFDMDELEETIQSHQFNLNDLDINLEDFDIQIEKLNLELEELDMNMEDLDEEMEKLDAFIDELKKELVVGGYINNENEDVEIKISAKEILVNGEKLTDELLDKCKNIYRKYMGKDLSETSNIHIH